MPHHWLVFQTLPQSNARAKGLTVLSGSDRASRLKCRRAADKKPDSEGAEAGRGKLPSPQQHETRGLLGPRVLTCPTGDTTCSQCHREKAAQECRKRKAELLTTDGPARAQAPPKCKSVHTTRGPTSGHRWTKRGRVSRKATP